MSKKPLPYEIIVKAHKGDPEAIEAVLSHYAGYIKYAALMDGRVNTDVEKYAKQKLIESILKFKFNR